ncbi:MAG: SDR family oxidoreductase [Myxococcales bacterium]|nr:SDR family oxidoreductase [Myxococcales bacterium]
MQNEERHDDARPLAGRVAVVTGASRGAGKGIAIELGAAGATVYVTGRSTRKEGAPAAYADIMRLSNLSGMPGTVEDTALEVTRAGGHGVACVCDHSSEEQVADLFQRLSRNEKRLDLLVNNAWGGHEVFDGVFEAPFWERPLSEWDAMIDRGVRNHWLASRQAAPIFVAQRSGLVVTTTFWDRGRYLRGNLLYDLAKSAMSRLAFAVAEELRAYGVASVALSPGWMRTELVLAGNGTDEARWQEVPALAQTESPRYLGRAVVALARDEGVLARTGQTLRVADLARELGFTDLDGRWVPPFELPEHH